MSWWASAVCKPAVGRVGEVSPGWNGSVSTGIQVRGAECMMISSVGKKADVRLRYTTKRPPQAQQTLVAAENANHIPSLRIPLTFVREIMEESLEQTRLRPERLCGSCI